MNQCRFCGCWCGQREFCDEVCFSEFEEEMAILKASRDEDLPVGETPSSIAEWDEPPVFDGDF